MNTTPAGHRRRWLSIAAMAAIVVLALPVVWLAVRDDAEPANPSSFYTPPEDLPDGPAGTLIRSETVPSISDAIRVWRVLYTSTGTDGQPVAVSGIVAAPTGTAPAGGWPVVAWAHGTVGVASRCANSTDADAGVYRIPGFAEVVGNGNVLVATDYQGIGTPGMHPYLVGQSEGDNVLDSVRAARHLLANDVGDTVAIYGHSQGGHATLWAAQAAATYAPELHVVGAAAMAPPTDLGVLLERDAAEPQGIVLTALAVKSWSTLYPQAKLSAIVHDESVPFVDNLAEGCVATTDEGLVDVPDILALKAAFLSQDPSTAAGWSELLTTNSPSATRFPVPGLVVQGLIDTLVRPDVTEAWVAAQCSAGADLQLNTYARAGHFTVRDIATPEVVDWLQARIEGQPVTPGCTHVAH